MSTTSKRVAYGRYIAVGVLLLTVLCVALALVLTGTLHVQAQDVTMESDGDAFQLTETSYGADRGFVFSATVSFSDSEGYAAGLVFGAQEDSRYWVFNVDREANRVKLMYFSPDAGGNMTAEVLRETYFIGNDAMTAADAALVNPRVRTIGQVQLKVVVTPDTENGHVYAEFYADNIRRFRTTYTDDDVIDLNALRSGLTYEGGSLGYNCFRSRVSFAEVTVGQSDYAYYTELYRQQYHYSQYAHWNNDPNGLVYYDGWYHLYYQHHPYSNYWSDMYWGHARSRDLTHWEQLPICLFPNEGTEGLGEGNGYAWSGSAMVYRPGMSADIDAENWFPNGGGTGLLAFYTRDGARQDQVIMTSDDGGISWVRRRLIPQSAAAVGIDGKTDCRDPKVFPVQTDGAGHTTLWGMVLSGLASDRIWFLKSENLLDWTWAGGFTMESPECPDLVTLELEGDSYTVMTFTGRRYIVGHLDYDAGSGQIRFLTQDGAVLTDATSVAQVMDYGPDSYATQTFYIDDSASEFYGETVSVSWFSGVPGAPASIESGALAAARKIWNGGGMTIPVSWGLKREGSAILLTQTPLPAFGSAFASLKTELVAEGGISLGTSSGNLLADVATHCFELSLTVTNEQNVPVCLRLNMNDGEYIEVGWNAEEGYYVDRSHAGDAGLNLSNYFARYSTGPCGSGKQTFYILSDNGGIEVFCEEFSRPFYVLTFSSPYATSASLSVGGDVTVDSLRVNEIGTVWRSDIAEGETVLYVDRTDLHLDGALTPSCNVMAYSTAGGSFVWEVTEGADAVSVTPTPEGATITSLKPGNAVVRVSCGNAVREIRVTMTGGTIESDISFSPDGKHGGEWYYTAEGLVGEQASGDGFLLSGQSSDNFTYTAVLDMGDGAAAALVFRATQDMSDYLIANYDRNGRIVKLWSPRGEIGRASVTVDDPSHLVLKVRAQGRDVTVSLNGSEVIRATLSEEEPTEGLFGLNVCATRAVFHAVTLFRDNWEYSGGNLTVSGDVSQIVYELYNRTLNNVRVSPAFYTSSGRALVLSQTYFELLPAGTYLFTAQGTETRFDFRVTVSQTSPGELVTELTVEEGSNAVIHLGQNLPGEVRLDGAVLPEGAYTLRDGVLTVPSERLGVGDHTLEVAGTSVTVHVTALKTVQPKPSDTADTKPQTPEGGVPVGLIVGLSVGGAVLLAGGAALMVVLVRKKKKKGKKAETDGNND